MYLRLTLSLLFLLTLFLVSQFIFNPANLYYEIVWLDIPMHVLGGLAVVLSLIYSGRAFGKEFSYTALLFLFLAVAALWETYEYLHDLVNYQVWNGWFDTIKDTLDGIIGMTAGYFFTKKQS